MIKKILGIALLLAAVSSHSIACQHASLPAAASSLTTEPAACQHQPSIPESQEPSCLPEPTVPETPEGQGCSPSEQTCYWCLDRCFKQRSPSPNLGRRRWLPPRGSPVHLSCRCCRFHSLQNWPARRHLCRWAHPIGPSDLCLIDKHKLIFAHISAIKCLSYSKHKQSSV